MSEVHRSAFPPPDRHRVISLYCCFACHGCHVFKQRFQVSDPYPSQKQDCQAFPEKVLPPSRPYRLAGTALMQYSFPPNGSISNPKSSNIYGLDFKKLLPARFRDTIIGGLMILEFYWSCIHETFLRYVHNKPFMCRMLIDNIKFILKLNQPVSIKNLSDQLMTASGFRSKKFLLAFSC